MVNDKKAFNFYQNCEVSSQSWAQVKKVNCHVMFTTVNKTVKKPVKNIKIEEKLLLDTNIFGLLCLNSLFSKIVTNLQVKSPF